MHQDQGRLLCRTSELALGFLDPSAGGDMVSPKGSFGR